MPHHTWPLSSLLVLARAASMAGCHVIRGSWLLQAAAVWRALQAVGDEIISHLYCSLLLGDGLTADESGSVPHYSLLLVCVATCYSLLLGDGLSRLPDLDTCERIPAITCSEIGLAASVAKFPMPCRRYLVKEIKGYLHKHLHLPPKAIVIMGLLQQPAHAAIGPTEQGPTR